MQSGTSSVPRRRSTRGHRRGRGRDLGRGRGRPSSQGRVPGSSGTGAVKHQKPSYQKLADLGSNDYRFRQLDAEHEGQEDGFDVGVDFADAATGSIGSGPNLFKYETEVVSVRERMMEADLGGLEKALKSLPLWVRLGDVVRFGLRISDHDVEEDYLETVAEGDSTHHPSSLPSGRDNTATSFAETLATLSFDDEDDVGIGAPVEKLKSEVTGSVNDKACSTTSRREPSFSPPADDFDKWLKDV